VAARQRRTTALRGGARSDGPSIDPRILLPDLVRRVAALTMVSAVGIALLAPLTARSAIPEVAEGQHLLAAADRSPSSLGRGALSGRDALAANVSDAVGPSVAEALVPEPELPQPGVAPMEATLVTILTAPVRRASAAAPQPDATGAVAGLATWYCCSRGYRGEAVVALPGALGGGYEPPPATRTVTVCADRCAVLPVVDYCGCHWGTSAQRVADLSPEAWAAVTDKDRSAGVLGVTVHLGG
jgi:hypothetical protein